MYLFGGSQGENENVEMYSLDLSKNNWQLIKPKPLNGDSNNLPQTRDEHSAIIYHESMVIFGGFSFGERSSDIFKYQFKQNTWERIHFVGDKSPIPRAGHSAIVKYDDADGDKMYIFGGKDDENTKLNDVWRFNFRTCQWSLINCLDEPTPRSGHSAQVYRDYMLIYGGIFEVTKELNDMHIFDLKNERWLCLFEELNSPKKGYGMSAMAGGSGYNKTPSLKND